MKNDARALSSAHPVRCLFLHRRFFREHEDRAAAFAPPPLDFGLDESGAGADAGDAAALERLLVLRVEARAVVFEREREVARVVEADGERDARGFGVARSEEHTSELQSHSFISYAVFCL